MPIYLGDKLISKEYVDSYESGLLYLGSNIVQGNVDYKVSDLGLVAYYDISNPNCYTSGSTTIFDLTANNNDMTISDGVVSYNPNNSGILTLNNGYAVATTTANLPSGSGVDPASIVNENTLYTPSRWEMDPGLEGENQKTGAYYVEYCFKDGFTANLFRLIRPAFWQNKPSSNCTTGFGFNLIVLHSLL